VKTLFVSNYSAYGDQIAVSGMINFLSFYYDKIFILVSWDFVSVVDYLYRENDKVQPMSYDYFMFTDIASTFPGYFECMCLLGEDYFSLDESCLSSSGELIADVAVTVPDFVNKNICEEVYSQKNPIGSKFGFSVPRNKNLDMVSEFYNKMGFPDELKYKCFNFQRSTTDEERLAKSLSLADSYAVVCEYGNDTNIISRKFVKSNSIVNIHMLSEKYFDVVKVIENAKEVHLIENSFAMLIYFLQLSGKMKRVPINFHAYYRKEHDRKLNYQVYMKPKLDNWTFIFDSSNLTNEKIKNTNLFYVEL